MRKGFLVVALFALAGLAAVAAWPKDTPRPIGLWVAKPETVLALQWKRDTAYIVRADAKTLRPLRGQSLPVAHHAYGASFSPDGKVLALGGDSGDVWLVDTRRLRVTGSVGAEGYGHVVETAWLGGRLVAVVDRCCSEEGVTEGLTVSVLDPVRRRGLMGHPLNGSIQAAERTDSKLVLLVGPRADLGPARLVLADADGGMATVALDRIAAGAEIRTGATVSRSAKPGLALDREGNRAFVVGAGAPVAEVDLATLSVKYHDLRSPVSLLRRVRDWLEPAAAAKVLPDGPERHARWLGNGYLAVWGVDNSTTADQQGNFRMRQSAAGVKLIDTRDWSVRTIDGQASGLAVADRTLFVFGSLWDSVAQQSSGVGLTAYGQDGSRRFHRFGDAPLYAVHVVGSRAFAASLPVSEWSYAVLDAQTGRVLRRISGPMPEPILP
jgi:hypothetical protein